MKPLRMIFGAACASAALASAQPAQAYPIDCAILLCMAGGFPASAECSAAKAEVIRRITPWPVEPPLQLWNCPMSIPADVAQAIGLAEQELGRDGLTPEVREYRDAIEIYHVRMYSRRTNSDGDEIVTDSTERGHYDEDGQFHWVRASYENGPEWLAEVAGGARVPIRQCVSWGRDDCNRYEIVRYENRAGAYGYGYLRGVLIRTKDHEGNYQDEIVRY